MQDVHTEWAERSSALVREASQHSGFQKKFTRKLLEQNITINQRSSHWALPPSAGYSYINTA
jgi:hypothetical protein